MLCVRSCVAQGQRKQLSASGATDGRPHHQKPSFATLAAVVTDFRNEIGTKQTCWRSAPMSAFRSGADVLHYAGHVGFWTQSRHRAGFSRRLHLTRSRRGRVLAEVSFNSQQGSPARVCVQVRSATSRRVRYLAGRGLGSRPRTRSRHAQCRYRAGRGRSGRTMRPAPSLVYVVPEAHSSIA